MLAQGSHFIVAKLICMHFVASANLCVMHQHRMIEIPAMNITVQLSYNGVEGGFIKTGALETDAKTINSCGDASERTPVASFPKLVSHSELGQSEALEEGHSSLVIHVDMNMRSS